MQKLKGVQILKVMMLVALGWGIAAASPLRGKAGHGAVRGGRVATGGSGGMVHEGNEVSLDGNGSGTIREANGLGTVPAGLEATGAKGGGIPGEGVIVGGRMAGRGSAAVSGKGGSEAAPGGGKTGMGPVTSGGGKAGAEPVGPDGGKGGIGSVAPGGGRIGVGPVMPGGGKTGMGLVTSDGGKGVTGLVVPTKDALDWMNLDEAAGKLQKEQRPVLIDLYTTWCGWCKQMDKKTYSNKQVAQYLQEKFYPVKLDAETRAVINWKGKAYRFNADYKSNEFAVYLTHGQLEFPTTIIIPPGGEPQAIPGYMEPKELELLVKYFGEGKYNKVSFDVYQKSFKASW